MILNPIQRTALDLLVSGVPMRDIHKILKVAKTTVNLQLYRAKLTNGFMTIYQMVAVYHVEPPYDPHSTANPSTCRCYRCILPHKLEMSRQRSRSDLKKAGKLVEQMGNKGMT